MALDPIQPDPTAVAGGMATVDPNQTPVIAVPRPQQQQPAQQQPVQEVQPPPRPVPIAYSLVRGLINPQSQTQALGLSRPASRTDVIENFIAQFATALSSGLSISHGPGAAFRGAASAIGAPYAQSLQQYQLGQQAQMQQAQMQEEQARTALTTAQTGLTTKQAELARQMATVNIPGMGPMTVPINQLGNIFKGAAGAGIAAQSRITAEQLRLQAQAGQVARVLPGIDPQTNQPAMLAYDRQNRLVGVVPGAFDPKLLPKVSTSQQWLQTSPGVGDLVSICLSGCLSSLP